MAEVWVAGVATLAAGALAADAARDAGRSSQAGYDRATEESARQYDQSREDQMPWLESGRNALAGIDRLNSGDASAFFKDPGYNFRLDQGVNALDRSAAAGGSLGSGGHSVDLMEYGQGFGSNEYGNFYNRLAGVAGVGQSAAQNLGALGAQAAGQQGQYAIGAGNARASGYLNQADIAGQTIAGIGGQFNNYLQGNSARNGGGTPWYLGSQPGRG